MTLAHCTETGLFGQFSLIQFSPNSWYLKCHWSLFLDNALGYQAIWMSGLSFSIQRVQNLLKPLRNCADASKLEGKGTLTEKCWHERLLKLLSSLDFFALSEVYSAVDIRGIYFKVHILAWLLACFGGTLIHLYVLVIRCHSLRHHSRMGPQVEGGTA